MRIPSVTPLLVWLLSSTFAIIGHVSWADGPVDNQDAHVRRIPPIGLELGPEVRAELIKMVDEIDRVVPVPSGSTLTDLGSAKIDWWNDVRVITRAVKLTIEGEQFYKEPEIEQARKLLALAREYASELGSVEAKNPTYQPSWSKKSGRMIAGYQSRLDDTIQPFGIIVPEQAAADPTKPRRLDIWLHGRDENVSEVAFLFRRWTQDSQ